jgi:hypothetical protein
MDILKKANKILAAFLLLFAIAFLYFSRNLNFGAFSSPKIGFMPKTFGVGMLFFAILNMIKELRKSDEVPNELVPVNWKKAGLYAADCVLYVILMIFFGYLPSTLICLFLMIKFTGIKGYVIPAITTLAVSLFFFGVFNVLLHVPLPRGKFF